MAFIFIEKMNKELYEQYLTQDQQDQDFTKFLYQRLKRECTEDDVVDFLSYCVGRELFIEFFKQRGFMGSEKQFVIYSDKHIQQKIEEVGIGVAALSESFERIYRYFMAAQNTFWMQNVHLIESSLRVDTIMRMAYNYYMSKNPCTSYRTQQGFESTVSSIVNNLPDEERVKWSLLCEMQQGDFFYRHAETFYRRCQCSQCGELNLMSY